MLRRIGKYTTAKLKRAWQAAIHYDRLRREAIIYARYLDTPLSVLTDPVFDTVCGVNWICGTGWLIGSGVATSDGTQVGNSDLSDASLLIVGETYRVVFEVTAYTAGNVSIGLGTEFGTLRAATGTFEENILCTGTNDITFRADLNFVGSVDNIVIYPTS